MAKLEATSRRLLDNITPGNRESVERRLSEIDQERTALTAQVDSLDRLALSKAEIRDLIDETAAFIARLEPTLREGPLHERQTSMRKCVQAIELDKSRGVIHINVRPLPMPVQAAQSESVAIVKVSTRSVRM